MILRMPHPDDFWFGAFYGLVRHLIPEQTFSVYYDEHEPRREQGGAVTIIHIAWE